MPWIFFALLSGLLWAFVNTLDKIVVSKWNPHPAFLLGIFISIELIVSFFIFLLFPFPAISFLNIGLALVAGACYIAMAYCYFKAILHDEISRLAPLFQISSLFLVIFAAVFLGEILSLPQYLGMAALISGAFLLSMRFPYHLRSARAFLYMLIGSLFYATNQLLLKYVLSFADTSIVFALQGLGGFLSALPFIFIHRGSFVDPFRQKNGRLIGLFSLSETLNIIGVFSLTMAFSTGPVTLSNALSSLKPFFLLLITIFFSRYFPLILKEETQASSVFVKIAAVLLIFAGAFFVMQ